MLAIYLSTLLYLLKLTHIYPHSIQGSPGFVKKYFFGQLVGIFIAYGRIGIFNSTVYKTEKVSSGPPSRQGLPGCLKVGSCLRFIRQQFKVGCMYVESLVSLLFVFIVQCNVYVTVVLCELLGILLQKRFILILRQEIQPIKYAITAIAD